MDTKRAKKQRTSYPGVTLSKRTDQRYQIGWVPPEATDGKRIWEVLETKRRDKAKLVAEEKSRELAEKKRRIAERLGVNEEFGRWSIRRSIEDWIDRPGLKGRTRKKNRQKISLFRSFCEEAGRQYLDEIRFEDGLAYRERIDARKNLAATKNGYMIAARSFLSWCVGKRRLRVNPFAEGQIDLWKEPNGSWDKNVRYLNPQQREIVWSACESTQERLIVALTMLAGLRASEAIHLRWRNWLPEVAEVDVTYSEPDEDDPEGFDPKTGERVVTLFFPEVNELLKQWYAETPYGRGRDDWILVDPFTGGRYKELPVRFRRRVYRNLKEKFPGDENVDWGFQIGRRIATVLAMVHAERLTGRTWSVQDLEAQFGHSHKIANDYYRDKRVNRIRRLETEYLAGKSATTESIVDPNHKGLSAEFARELLGYVMEREGVSRGALSRQMGDDGPRDTTICNFLNRRTKMVPSWYWDALRALVSPQPDSGATSAQVKLGTGLTVNP